MSEVVCGHLKQQVTSSGVKLLFLLLENDFYSINWTRADFAPHANIQ
jgi:hypothetical protein